MACDIQGPICNFRIILEKLLKMVYVTDIPFQQNFSHPDRKSGKSDTRHHKCSQAYVNSQTKMKWENCWQKLDAGCHTFTDGLPSWVGWLFHLTPEV